MQSQREAEPVVNYSLHIELLEYCIYCIAYILHCTCYAYVISEMFLFIFYVWGCFGLSWGC